MTRHSQTVNHPNTALDIEDLSLSRGGHALLQGLTLNLGSGTVLWLTGPNGSGKTSLLLACAGLLPIDGGSITWNGSEDPACHVSYAAFSGPEREGLTVGEDLKFWQTIHADQTPTAERLDPVGLKPFIDNPVTGLSTGQRRRLALARLSLMNTSIWLLDEPLVGLDKAGQALVMKAVAAHSEDGGITLIASHQPLKLPKITAQQLIFEAVA